MESIRPEGQANTGLATGPRMVSHGGNVGPQPGNELDDLAKPPRFQRPPAAAPLDGMPPDFPHHSQGDMRALRELALPPDKLTHPATDRTSDRSPVSRYAFGHVRTSAFHFQRRQ